MRSCRRAFHSLPRASPTACARLQPLVIRVVHLSPGCGLSALRFCQRQAPGSALAVLHRIDFRPVSSCRRNRAPAGSGRCGTDARPIRFPAARNFHVGVCVRDAWRRRSFSVVCDCSPRRPRLPYTLAQAVLAQEPVWRHALSLFGEPMLQAFRLRQPKRAEGRRSQARLPGHVR